MIKKERVRGTLNNLIDSKVAALPLADRGQRTALEGVAYDVADAAIIVCRERIAAGLRRVGIEFDDTDTITADKIFEAIKVKSGIDLRSFDIEELKTQALKGLSTSVSEKLGFEVDLDNGVTRAIEDAVEAAIKAGGSHLVTLAKKAALRRLALARKAGVTVREIKKIENAKRQAKFRESAPPAVWVDR
jgi:hypothetical protein